MSNNKKDFLSELAGEQEIKKEEKKSTTEFLAEDSTPASFQQEKRIKIEKPKRTINPIALITGGIVLLLGLAILIWWFFFPHITMPDFVGKNVSEVSTWAKQNQFQSSVIAQGEAVYSLEYDRDVVVSQSVAAGKKVKKTTPITIIVSKGPNPDENVTLPDLTQMNREEISKWIDDNKLLKAKITLSYSETVEADQVIKVDYKNGSDLDFKRGSAIEIFISKGKAPAGEIAVEDFTGKTFTEANTWATKKKLTVEKVEAYDQKVEAGVVISQSKKTGETLKENDTITFVVSKGKGVSVPNLIGYTEEQFDAWSKNKDNSVVVVDKEIYNDKPKGTIISQSLKAGSVVDSGSVLEVTKSLYLPILQTSSQQWIGKDYLELKAWVDEVNSKGASIQAGTYGYEENGICMPDKTDGAIIEIKCSGGTSDLADGCGRPLTLNARIAYRYVNNETCPVTPTTDTKIVLSSENVKSLSEIQKYCTENKLSCSYEEVSTITVPVKVLVDGKEYASGQFSETLINKSAVIEVEYNSSVVPSPSSTPEN